MTKADKKRDILKNVLTWQGVAPAFCGQLGELFDAAEPFEVRIIVNPGGESQLSVMWDDGCSFQQPLTVDNAVIILGGVSDKCEIISGLYTEAAKRFFNELEEDEP